jgi:malate dehydrogenase (quinone)
MTTEYDVVIVGGGVTGTALLYVLSLYSNVGRVALIEKNAGVAEVNSHPLNNAQTSHDGSTETNYSLKHALEVKYAATLLRRYVEKKKVPGLFSKTTRMVLGVGRSEVTELKLRYAIFSEKYPDLRLIDSDELLDLEPMVVYNRDPEDPVAALVTNEGYAINYQRLAQCFAQDALRSPLRPLMYFNTRLTRVEKRAGGYTLFAENGREIATKTIVFAAGAYSLQYAHELGYAQNLGILPIAGSFFTTPKKLKGKVYRVQKEGMPFAAIHGDPDVTDSSVTRFGPTTKPLPLMERHHWRTARDFAKMPNVSWRGLGVMLKIVAKKNLLWYVIKNAAYDLPLIGPLFFLKEARQIVPTLRYRDLKLRRGAGGIRPQIVNLDTSEMEMGDKTIVGDGVIFNTTPSPGASVCLANAERDVLQLSKFLPNLKIDLDRFHTDLGLSTKAETISAN